MSDFSLYKPPTTKPRRPTSVARSLSTVRTRRLRISWFSLGVLSSILTMGAINLISENSSEYFTKKQSIKLDSLDALLNKKQEKQNPTIAKIEPSFEATQAPVPIIEWPQELKLRVGKGETLAGILGKQGVGKVAAYNVVEAMKPHFNLRKLREDQRLRIIIDKDPSRPDDPEAAILLELSFYLNKLETIEIKAKKGAPAEFTVKKTKKKLKTVIGRSTGKISSGKTISGIAAAQGTPNSIINKLMRAYSYDIDFQRGIHAGDTFDILYEKLVSSDGTLIKGGDIQYAMLKTNGKTRKIYYYEDKQTTGRFYNYKGESVIKKLLKTPIDGARISSGFGMRRHPILGYSKMHTGIDFAASRGTRVFAAGEGTVVFAGRNGGYGNQLRIKHNGTYTTSYSHLQRFGRGIKKGKQVKQEQIVAYVGSTGRSTGPHLHYEILKNGKKINPKKVKFTGGDRLRGSRLTKFKAMKSKIENQLAKIKPSQGAKAKETKVANR